MASAISSTKVKYVPLKINQKGRGEIKTSLQKKVRETSIIMADQFVEASTYTIAASPLFLILSPSNAPSRVYPRTTDTQ